MKDDHVLALCGAGVLSDSRVLDDPSSLPPCRRSPRSRDDLCPRRVFRGAQTCVRLSLRTVLPHGSVSCAPTVPRQLYELHTCTSQVFTTIEFFNCLFALIDDSVLSTHLFILELLKQKRTVKDNHPGKPIECAPGKGVGGDDGGVPSRGDTS